MRKTSQERPAEPQVPVLGPLEHELLRLLWSNGPATAGTLLAIHNQATGKALSYSTIITILTRMVTKGVLRVDRERQPFCFSAAVTREHVTSQRLREFVRAFFDGRQVDLALMLVAETELTPDAIERLERLLHAHRARSGQP